MKIATWNINSIKMRLEQLNEFVSRANPDILLLQELKCETEKFPHEELSDLPYNFYIHGQKSYNGVAILSKYQADEINYDFPGNPLPEQSRFIEFTCQTPIGFCRIISLYAPNGGEVGSDKYLMKLQFYDALILYLESIKSPDEKLIIGGDFNIAPYDIDVYSPEKLANSTCFTLPERQKLRALLNSSFEDLYRLLNAGAHEYSWWDYRGGDHEHNRGMRIDTILASSNAVGNFKNSYIDYKMRSNPKPSDHAPVVAGT